MNLVQRGSRDSDVALAAVPSKLEMIEDFSAAVIQAAVYCLGGMPNILILPTPLIAISINVLPPRVYA